MYLYISLFMKGSPPRTLNSFTLSTTLIILFIDLKSISRALIQNIRSGYVKEGGSTITQQVARLLFLNNDLSFQRKIKEIFISLILEFRYNKIKKYDKEF